jgi:A/G-specific adenine glycosylase
LRFPILDGNVKRVLSRYHGVRGWPGSTSTQKSLWEFADSHTPHERVVDYTQAIMDLGATVCVRSRPRCPQCPLASDCVANIEGLTAQLPESKPSRALPTRATMMLIVRDGSGRLLLQRRPSVGVWAQLWSLPEAADIESAKSSIATIATQRKDDIAFRHLRGFTHTFSHYKLDITPIACDVERVARIADVSESRWLLPEEAAQLGLPAPVRKLIEEFAKENRRAEIR